MSRSVLFLVAVVSAVLSFDPARADVRCWGCGGGGGLAVYGGVHAGVGLGGGTYGHVPSGYAQYGYEEAPVYHVRRAPRRYVSRPVLEPVVRYRNRIVHRDVIVNRPVLERRSVVVHRPVVVHRAMRVNRTVVVQRPVIERRSVVVRRPVVEHRVAHPAQVYGHRHPRHGHYGW